MKTLILSTAIALVGIGSGIALTQDGSACCCDGCPGCAPCTCVECCDLCECND